MDSNEAWVSVNKEYKKASHEFRSIISPHEGLAIIQEEFEELKAEVFKNHKLRDQGQMKKEATHLAAMAMRFLIDLC